MASPSLTDAPPNLNTFNVFITTGKINPIFGLTKIKALQNKTFNNLDVKLQLNQVNFLTKTHDQVNKDLNGLCDQTISITPKLLEAPLIEFTIQLDKILIYLEKINRLNQFIYLIDLKESIFLAYQDRSISLSELSYAVIERAAQKVYLRAYFSQK